MSRDCFVIINVAGINYTGVRRAYHTAVISTDAGYSHVTKRRRKNVSPPPHRRQCGNATRCGNRNEPVDSQSAPRRILTIRRLEYFTGFELLGQESDTTPRHRFDTPFSRREIKYLIFLTLKLRNRSSKYLQFVVSNYFNHLTSLSPH